MMILFILEGFPKNPKELIFSVDDRGPAKNRIFVVFTTFHIFHPNEGFFFILIILMSIHNDSLHVSRLSKNSQKFIFSFVGCGSAKKIVFLLFSQFLIFFFFFFSFKRGNQIIMSVHNGSLHFSCFKCDLLYFWSRC